MVYRMREKTQTEISQTERYLTYDQMNIIIAVQKMWLKIALFIRTYVKALTYNTRNLNSVTRDLSALPNEASNIFLMFYGPEAADTIKNILSDFIQSAMEVIEAIKDGDTVLTDSKIMKWYGVADRLSSFLARTNIYWDEENWKYLLYIYIKSTIAQINAVVNEDDEVEMQIYNDIERINYLMANYMGKGIISSNFHRFLNQ